MSTILAQATAQAVVAGPGSIGPFAVPVGAVGVQFVIDRATLPDLAGLLNVICQGSYDGGATFRPLGGAGVDGGSVTVRGGTVLAQSELAFFWRAAPTHIRIDVNSRAAFSAGFTVSAL